MLSAGAALPASAYSTSKNTPGIFYLKKDTKETNKKGKTVEGYKVLRKGYYTGYQLNDKVVVLATGNSLKKVSVKKATLKYRDDLLNSVNITGAYSQLAGIKRRNGYYNGYPYGCGPTSAATMISYELARPYNNTYVPNTTLINYYKENPKEAAKFLFSGTLKSWCLYDGTTNVGMKKIFRDYAVKYGKKSGSVVKLDPADASSPAVLISCIDTLLRSGRRVFVTVNVSSAESESGTKNKYPSTGGATHYVVITAENGYRGGKYFISDPWYNETERYTENGLQYYYGMQVASKTSVVKSMMNAGGSLERSLIYIK